MAKYASKIAVRNAEFKVSEAGRQRVLLEKRKNVHAAIVGEESNFGLDNNFRRVFYNPYKQKTFYDINGESVLRADCVIITGDKKGYEIHVKNH